MLGYADVGFLQLVVVLDWVRELKELSVGDFESRLAGVDRCLGESFEHAAERDEGR
jgi:hypothetical protein